MGTSYKNFEEYLSEKFMEDFHGSKDQYEAAFDRWLSDLEGGDYVQYANTYGELRELQAIKGKGAHGY